MEINQRRNTARKRGPAWKKNSDRRWKKEKNSERQRERKHGEEPMRFAQQIAAVVVVSVSAST